MSAARAVVCATLAVVFVKLADHFKKCMQDIM